MPSTILLVEDDKAIADNVLLALEREGYFCVHVLFGGACLEAVKTRTIDLVILDVGLPDMNGFEVCKGLRAFSDVPVIFLTARSDEVDRVVGLEIGADDYVLKPFSPRELAARVKTILRRRQPVVATVSGCIQIDEARVRATCKGIELELTRAEFSLLRAMHASPGIVFSRERLMNIAGLAEASMERAIDTHIKSLRAKLAAAAPDIEFIRTHRGLGYSLEPSATP